MNDASASRPQHERVPPPTGPQAFGTRVKYGWCNQCGEFDPPRRLKFEFRPRRLRHPVPAPTTEVGLKPIHGCGVSPFKSRLLMYLSG